MTTYKEIVYKDYNFGFCRLRKDICDFCSTHLQKVKEDQEAAKTEYDKHCQDIEEEEGEEVTVCSVSAFCFVCS